MPPAIGVTEEEHRMVPWLQAGGRESASSRRGFFKDLKGCSLDGANVTFGAREGLTGLKRVLQEEFMKAKIQRRREQEARHVVAKVPRKLKRTAADEVPSIFCASSR